MSSQTDSFVASGSSQTPDFLSENHGSVFLLRPVSSKIRASPFTMFCNGGKRSSAARLVHPSG